MVLASDCDSTSVSDRASTPGAVCDTTSQNLYLQVNDIRTTQPSGGDNGLVGTNGSVDFNNIKDVFEKFSPANLFGHGGDDTPRLFGEEIKPENVIQGDEGTCFFMSTLAAMAGTENGQKQIQDMIKQNDDGSYTVTFPGDKSNPVTIDGAGPQADNGGAEWSKLIETAFLKYTHEGPGRDLLENQGIALTARVNNSRTAHELLTGKESATDQFSLIDMASGFPGFGATSIDNVEKDLKEAFDHDRVVTAGIAPDGVLGIGGHDGGPLTDGHIYSVLDYDSDKKMVTVRDPHGEKQSFPEGETRDGITSVGEGEYQMSLDTFYNTFSHVTINGRDPLMTGLRHMGNDLLNSGDDALALGLDIAMGDPFGAYKEFGDIVGPVRSDMINTVWDVLVRDKVMDFKADPIGFLSGGELSNLPGLVIFDPAAQIKAGENVVDFGKDAISSAGGLLKKGKIW